MEGLNFENKKFNSKEEELSFLREYVAQKEKEVVENGEADPKFEENVEREKVVKESIDQYGSNSPENVMGREALVPEHFRNEIVLELAPEDHDSTMGELITMVQEKGIINTIDVVVKMNNPHITDDFHRFLIQYLRSGYPVTGLKEKTPLSRSLNRTLFEVTLSYDNSNPTEDLQSFVGLMEQFYTGMVSVTDVDKDEYISIEVVNSINSRHSIFYISVPDSKKELLEKQIVSVFPDASVIEQKNDFNIFNYNGHALGGYVVQNGDAFKPIKTYDKFSSDSMDVLLNVFSKLGEETEGACLQLIFKPVGDFYLSKYKKGLSRLEKGEKSPEELYVRNTSGSKLMTGVSKLVKGGKKKEEGDISLDNNKIEAVKEKIGSTIVSTNFRVVVSAPNDGRASSILSDIKSAFNQFENTVGNKLEFREINAGSLKKFFKQFSFREYNPSYDAPMNIKEVSSLIHFPMSGKSSAELKVNNMKTSSAPVTISGTEGILLGTNAHRGSSTDIHFKEEDRMRHMYVIGQTGTGKTNYLKNMIIQDIKNGEGVCFIDPHGSDVQDVLANVPEERYDDVIYFDPSNIDNPMALNMLEYDVTKPEQKTFVVNELFSIFQKLYGANPESMGPMFEQYFRNATMLVIEDPDTGSTLLDVSRVLADEKFRNMKIVNCNNPVVKEFWTKIASKAGGEASLQNIVPYITSKFDVFLANDVMRPIVAQQKSSFNFRDIMDGKKILLVNLSKGSLGDINANLIGLILVGKILMAALSRSDSADRGYPPFYLYIDEFQNVTTDSISTILSEARKYKLSLNIAHQFIAQLNDSIKNSVFGNVGSMSIFRVGSDDAEYLERQLSPVFSAKDIMNIDNYNAYVKMLSGGVPADPFSIKVPPAPEGDMSKLDALKKLSAMKYSKSKAEVDQEISNRYVNNESDNLDI